MLSSSTVPVPAGRGGVALCCSDDRDPIGGAVAAEPVILSSPLAAEGGGTLPVPGKNEEPPFVEEPMAS